MTAMRRLAFPLLIICAACDPKPDDFADHTVPSLATQADYEGLAVGANGRFELKFIVTSFGTAPAIRFMDSRFFTLHDEWYWFRLLNGAHVPGREGIAPVDGLQFATVADIYTWAKAQVVLPLDLTWVDDGRLYSPRFYTLSLDVRPRAFGLGTLVHVTARGTRPERWAFQLEFQDNLTHAELTTFFERLDATVPKELSGQVFWVVRSPQQEALAKDMEAQQLRFHDRILRLKDLAVSGELEVYNGGLTAGRLRLIRSGESFEGTNPNDILLLEDVPDFLPPAAGVVTAVPQTPLAHFNLLAKNRGIPNVYLGGLIENQELEDLARLRVPVVLQASAPDKLVIKPISEANLSLWLQLQRKDAIAVQQVDVSALPYSHDLRTLRLADVPTLRPSIGGKATGYLALLDAVPDSTPDQLEAITIRSYAEHLAPFRARIEAMLAAYDFGIDARVRYLALEGEARFRTSHPADEQFLVDFLNTHGPGDVLGELARAGGLKDELRAAPLAPATLATLTTALQTRFGHYAVTQGLRFRSSSTAEDVEGFNGAGLYDSNTGYLDAAAQPGSGDRGKTVEWALKKTWASYWSFEAFEERAFERVDHLSGNMAVVVHANFDDPHEASNGVFLFTLQGERGVLELNVQAGALSVTNPTSTQLPEVDRVSLATATGTPTIERLRASTVVPAGTLLLTDEQLLDTFTKARAVAARWLASENVTRAPAQQATTLVLDFEFRQVAAGWPALKVGSLPPRIVLKQARPLEPGLRGLSAEVLALPLPRDLLRRARRVERRICESPSFTATLVELLTNPAATPDLGHASEPFTASLSVRFKAAVPELNVAQDEVVEVDHLGLSSVQHLELPARWSFAGSLPAGGKLTAVQLRESRFVLTGAATVEGSELQCTVQVLHSTPAEFLLSLL
ncbi:MAG: PEP/pyruvate-binding domain-containing protein [Archangium sp.]|nr:PEP/pyruvate-binding domain-containing protein [Archangium sp.]